MTVGSEPWEIHKKAPKATAVQMRKIKKLIKNLEKIFEFIKLNSTAIKCHT